MTSVNKRIFPVWNSVFVVHYDEENFHEYVVIVENWINSLRQSDAYMLQLTNHHWFR